MYRKISKSFLLVFSAFCLIIMFNQFDNFDEDKDVLNLNKTVQLCRTVEDETLWACLAVLAWQHRQLAVAEEAFALIRQYHQVSYIQYLRVSKFYQHRYHSAVGLAP